MKVSERLVGKGLTILGIAVLIMITAISINGSVWSDETNSLIYITTSYKDIIAKAVYDCHPPLYHMLLKIFIDLMKTMGFNRIYLSKIFSIIPFFLIYAFVILKTKNDKKSIVVGTFLFCLCAMPNLMAYAIQIRMYSWALFFVFMTFAFAYDVLIKGSSKSVLGVVLFSIFSMFTHYYACVSIAFIYLFILVYMFFNRKEKLKKFFVVALLMVTLFLPWFFSIFNTIKKVIGGFWIKPVTLNSLIGYIWFILFPNIYKYHLSGILGVIMTFTFLAVLCGFLLRKDKNNIDKIYVLMGIGCTGGTVLFGIAASLLLGPVYQDRFAYPSLAVLWLVFSVCVCSVQNKKVRNGIFILIFIFGIINISDVVGKELVYDKNLKKLEDEMKNMDLEKSVIVSDSYHITCCISFYCEEGNINVPVYLWNNEADGMQISNSMYQNLNNLGDIAIIRDAVKSKKNVLFLENIGYNSDFIEKCAISDMIATELGQYSIEDRNFVLYQISEECGN